MTSWIEPPPKQKGMGCLGKGCLLIVVFLVLLVVAFFIGGYAGIRYVVTSPKPREIPRVETSEAEQQAVRDRWDEFEAASRNKPEATSSPDGTPVPEVTPPANRIEFTANDINQLIAKGRKTRGRAFVSIDNDIARIQVSIPLEKVGFHGRYLNGEFAVHASADRDPRNVQVTQISLSGVDVPEAVLKALLGTRSLRSYVDEYASAYGISTLTIEGNKVVIETSGPR